MEKRARKNQYPSATRRSFHLFRAQNTTTAQKGPDTKIEYAIQLPIHFSMSIPFSRFSNKTPGEISFFKPFNKLRVGNFSGCSRLDC